MLKCNFKRTDNNYLAKLASFSKFHERWIVFWNSFRKYQNWNSNSAFCVVNKLWYYWKFVIVGGLVLTLIKYGLNIISEYLIGTCFTCLFGDIVVTFSERLERVKKLLLNKKKSFKNIYTIKQSFKILSQLDTRVHLKIPGRLLALHDKYI